eukprot:1105142-Rhodomonas_salina.3
MSWSMSRSDINFAAARQRLCAALRRSDRQILRRLVTRCGVAMVGAGIDCRTASRYTHPRALCDTQLSRSSGKPAQSKDSRHLHRSAALSRSRPRADRSWT